MLEGMNENDLKKLKNTSLRLPTLIENSNVSVQSPNRMDLNATVSRNINTKNEYYTKDDDGLVQIEDQSHISSFPTQQSKIKITKTNKPRNLPP